MRLILIGGTLAASVCGATSCLLILAGVLPQPQLATSCVRNWLWVMSLTSMKARALYIILMPPRAPGLL